MNQDLALGAAIFLGAFALLSFLDGVVFHLFLERLPFRQSSRLEHRLHTGRALVFPGLLHEFFGRGGPTSAGWVLLGVDQILEFWDMAIERRSRHPAGLSSPEYLLHGVLVTLRTAAVLCAALASSSGPGAVALGSLVSALLPGAVLVALVHLVLAVAPDRWSRFQARVPS